MTSYKACVDIGGTKTIFALVDSRLRIKKSHYIPTPQNRLEFIEMFSKELFRLSKFSNILNISIAGRVDKNGRVILSHNLPLLGVNIAEKAEKFFRHVEIDNDANCFAVYNLFKRPEIKKKSCLIIVWGTGIGGAFIDKGRLFRRGSLATEIGHIKLFDREKQDIESLIGGKYVEAKYGIPGEKLEKLASSGNEKAIEIFRTISKEFGRFIVSMSYIFDPDMIILGGSFVNSWKFMRMGVENTVKKEGIKKTVMIRPVHGKFYVIKGCYFLDEYERAYNKL